ncbi:Primosomal protein, replication factor Y [Candidatus Phytoplasma mali]|uniref:Replication restart protein PriA n=1 Tax=Phytoplasma mali (strain AT) TaxID=482235 RepID=B3QZW7_PHYMT|nr:primosomal protein N' [Candidatus Phytoplasma mali]CAP18504.1 Primosomal protein, replication factor Y [Candidatus Phytoplasma mali]
MIAQVVIDLKAFTLRNRHFDYIIPEKFHGMIQKGMRVIVPFGLKDNKRLGYVCDLVNYSDFAKKELLEVLDLEPCIDPELFLLAEEILKIPFISKALVYETVIPKGLLINYQKKVLLFNKKGISEEIIQKFNNKNEWLLNDSEYKKFGVELNKLACKLDILKIQTLLKPRYSEKKETFYYFNPICKDYHQIQLNPKEKHVIEQFKTTLNIKKIDFLKFSTYAVINNLLKKGIILKYEKNLNDFILHHNFSLSKNKKVTLNQEQEEALGQIDLNKNKVYLLYGKTGTGKTEVYLKLIEKILKNKRQVLILVPEIILIAPLAQRLKSKFTEEKISIMHSLLSSKERYNQYKMIKNQEATIILGTRSAIFSPLQSLGIIIIDEEHDESFIQKEQVSYDVKELAKIRTKYHNVPLILGSATPSLESHYNVQQNIYKLLTLNQRILVNNFPLIKLVDMKKELTKGNLEPFSFELKKKLNETLKKNEQAIIFINTKGYAPFLLCRFCGYVPKCIECNISLTFYKKKNLLKCNHCGFSLKFKLICPKCNQKKIKTFGIGIEYLENYLKQNFPTITIKRSDADTITKISQYENIWNEFNQNKYQILLGTQIISKGLDFSNVTLVGIIAADSLLKIPDFKASEKTFQLLMQTSGRAGRAKQGTVIIQSYDIDNYVIKSVASYQEKYVVQKLLDERKISQLPPFNYVSKILICHESYLQVFSISKNIKYILEQKYNKKEMIILGPILSLISKKNNKYRILLTLKYSKWPLNLDFILKDNILKNADIFFDRFAHLF